MEEFLHKITLAIFWVILLIHFVFQHFQLPYVAVTNSMLVSFLLLHLILNDNTIGRQEYIVR